MPDRIDPPSTVSFAPDVVSVDQVVRGLHPGDRIGIYRVVQPIGAGGMGVVYRASDDRLGRDVAIKLVHAERRSLGKKQLLLEAQAMAKLSHPNVVTVYEVGIFDDELFVAMELVEGETLRTWLSRARRPWREILRAFLEAGRGLAAAHEAKILHGDFKPDNVLRGADGRVRVTDFGLAASLDPPVGDEGQRRRTAPGTPAYMAPELFAGERPDARADQFSFCVALWEALAGKRPFAGDTLEELRRSMTAGVRGTLREVPPWLSRAVSRGLRVRREDRYPTMAELLHDLARDPARTRRRLAFAGMALVAAAGAVAFGVSRVEPCRGAPARLAGVWDAGVRAAMERSFKATGVPFAADTYLRVAAELDAWTRGWADMHREACEATVKRKEQSEALLDLRMICLDERLGQARALTGVLAGPVTVEQVEQAGSASRALAPVSECADTQRMTGAEPPSRDPAVLAVRRRLDHVDVLFNLSSLREAKAEVAPLVEAARATGYAPIRADALIDEAEILHQLEEELPRAEAELREAIPIAASARMDRAVARAWVTLMWMLGQQGRGEEALGLRTAAEAAIARARGRAVLQAGLAHVLGWLHRELGHNDQALESLLRSVALMEEELGKDDERTTPMLESLGVTYRHAGRIDESLTVLRRVVAAREAGLGPRHPDVGWGLAMLGDALIAAGRLDEALAADIRALALLEAAYGAENPRIRSLVSNVGALYVARSRYVDGLPYLERSLRILEQNPEAKPAQLAGTLENIGGVKLALGDVPGARRAFERADAIRRRALPPDHEDIGASIASLALVSLEERAPDAAAELARRAVAHLEKKPGVGDANLTQALEVLGRALNAQKRHAEAVPFLERAVAMREKLFGPEDGLTGSTLLRLGESHLGLGHPAAARPLLERAVAIRDKMTESDPLETGEPKLVLARVLWDDGDRARARKLAEEARVAFAAAGPRAASRRGEAEDWLARTAPAR